MHILEITYFDGYLEPFLWRFFKLMQKRTIIVAGHICLDITPHLVQNGLIEEVFSPGKLLSLQGASLTAGGVAGNTGLALKALGADVCIQALAGTDAFGKALEDILLNQGLIGLRFVSEQQTSFTIVIQVEGYDRIFLHNSGVNDSFTSDQVLYDHIKPGDIFHFGYPTIMKEMRKNGGEEMLRMFGEVKKRGGITSLDLTLPDADSESGRCDWISILRRVIPLVDVFTPSYEEILFMLDRNTYNNFRKKPFIHDPLENLELETVHQLSNTLIEWGAAMVLLKCGFKGIFLQTASSIRMKQLNLKHLHSSDWAVLKLFCPGFKPSRIVSTTGAGDSAIAGFLLSIHREKEPQDALRIAAATGARSLGARDSFSSIGTFSDVESAVLALQRSDIG